MHCVRTCSVCRGPVRPPGCMWWSPWPECKGQERSRQSEEPLECPAGSSPPSSRTRDNTHFRLYSESMSQIKGQFILPAVLYNKQYKIHKQIRVKKNNKDKNSKSQTSYDKSFFIEMRLKKRETLSSFLLPWVSLLKGSQSSTKYLWFTLGQRQVGVSLG